jgi:hypothetical protein
MGSANIWGVYPASNARFMKDTVTYTCKYIIGALYGIRNTWDEDRQLQYGDNQEDKERTLRYFELDGQVVRINYVTILTSYYSKGGMESPTRVRLRLNIGHLLLKRDGQGIRNKSL